MPTKLNSGQLIDYLRDARKRTLELLDGLSADQLIVPKLDIVNPLVWEVGHVGYFHELWILRHMDGRPPVIKEVDQLFDSIDIPHDARWEMSLPSLADTLAYLRTVHDMEVRRLESRGVTPDDEYFYQLAVFHEDMHTEAFTYTRQTLGYPKPRFSNATDSSLPDSDAGPLPGDVDASGGEFMLGAQPDDGFVFDNEKWAHPVTIAPFRIAKAPVTNEEYLRFVEADGYSHREFWSDEAWAWLNRTELKHPVYWKKQSAGWKVRQFSRWVRLPPHRPVIHVSWHEAQAYCRWAGRRLPTEAEWEYAAASSGQNKKKRTDTAKRRFPWGDGEPGPRLANLEGRALGPIDVGALPASDSAIGCRQMIGNVWEWTASDFAPYPGFTPDPYKEYSQPLFGNTKVLRGGCWATRGRMIRNTWRNFYAPERNDIFAGFRTCALT